MKTKDSLKIKCIQKNRLWNYHKNSFSENNKWRHMVKDIFESFPLQVKKRKHIRNSDHNILPVQSSNFIDTKWGLVMQSCPTLCDHVVCA